MIAIAPTDFNWYTILKSELLPKHVNFWTPTPWNVKGLKENERFYFLLKSPYRKIAGYGLFEEYKNMTAREAWREYGRSNGVNDLRELINRASKYALKNASTFIPTENPTIGCIILSDVVFLEENEFFKPEEVGLSFPPEVVKLKYFNIECIDRLEVISNTLNPFDIISDISTKYKANKSKDREGQNQFRSLILEAYGNKCCITGEVCLNVVEAAHIQPYISKSSNHIQNGLPMRVDLHTLFDAGLLTIDENYIIHISSYLDSSYYSTFDGKHIMLPSSKSYYPSISALQYHNKLVFRD